MRNQRAFSLEFKRQLVEELLSGESRPVQLRRRHNITAGLLYHWKKQYSRGKFNNEPTATPLKVRYLPSRPPGVRIPPGFGTQGDTTSGF